MYKRQYRRRIAKLTTKDISKCQFFITEGRNMNAHKVELKFERDNNVVASVFSSMMRHTSRLLSDGMIIATLFFDMELKRLSHSI